MSEREYNKIYNKLYKCYFSEALPILREEDEERIEILKSSVRVSICLWLIALTLIFIFFKHEIYNISDDMGEFLMALIILCIVGPFFIYISNKKDFERKIKARLMPLLCKCLGEMKWFDSRICASETTIKKTKIFEEFNISEYDDQFEGTYKEIPIKIIEADYKMERHNGKRKVRVPIFKGIIIKIKMNKNFISHTVIRPNCLLKFSPAAHLEHTTLEDVEFEKKYDVFTSDETEARYLITTSFMERLNNIKQIFNAQKVSCGFYQKNIYIALHTKKDLFSICALHKPIYDYGQFDTFFKEIISIYKLIDYFKFSEKIGL